MTPTFHDQLALEVEDLDLLRARPLAAELVTAQHHGEDAEVRASLQVLERPDLGGSEDRVAGEHRRGVAAGRVTQVGERVVGDVGDNALADLRYITGRHTAPSFAGDTVFASTEIRETRDLPGRPDLGVLVTTLRGHKFVKKDGTVEKIEIFYLERELAVKRRSHYA